MRDDKRFLKRVPVILSHLSGVMAGLVPAIHVFLTDSPQERRRCPRQARAWRWKGDSASSERAL